MTTETLKPYKLWLFLALGLICLSPLISSPIALLLGFTLASLGLVPPNIDLGKWTKKLLSYSIVGLGFGINLPEAISASSHNLGLIVGSIVFTLILSFVLTRALQLEVKTGHLIGCGTAICGGSAIAAVSPAINARNDQTAVALACIFLLNSIALFVFPAIGHALNMSQYDFGVWSAIAIHDTSSVVGAASAYGDEALKTATTIKLARALWIIPVAMLSAVAFGGDRSKIRIPYFIGFYCLAILFAYFVPQGQPAYELLFAASKQVLIVCLYLIGAAITVSKMRANGPKPLLLGVLLWVSIGVASLSYILMVS
ncbi:YeiH family protein [Shewanella intestini]|uniref:Sulfate exporter family transporter n=1 Tax=Shewanella intestini TaxID=2017544 RepID=A0ABS5I3Q3_9GAMM|nr:putative sulfate exporter family transporter [Shewanella intestini]MBR9728649.1 putative sulfate exporter family transporter [Shewanella intestini]MRG37295.1 putative sulfate exporter family transporter [Shewanella sp. XMDDZSB0408]